MKTLLQSYNIGKTEGGIANVMGKSNPEKMADLFSIRGILKNKIYEIKEQAKKRENELRLSLGDTYRPASEEEIGNAIKNDSILQNLYINLGNLERAAGVIDNMTDHKAGIAGATSGFKPHELKAINQLFMNLNMDKLGKGNGLNQSNIDNNLRDLFKVILIISTKIQIQMIKQLQH